MNAPYLFLTATRLDGKQSKLEMVVPRDLLEEKLEQLTKVLPNYRFEWTCAPQDDIEIPRTV